ncbi:hypothetical protein BDP27DRAFT_1316329 [Rhodocollybia butyracea]|uniref:Uncharacterized protein n=1 Tax=Rhodocollybia butyracea TaxID=206335 RepID=A0A9P5Q5Z5_9AGAR|nr:hypothetical protein BDP27DRAFT_1316329 [Rhodocollybia butyracea]
MSTRKRKQVPKRERFTNIKEAPTVDPALTIQAHEADIIRGPRGHVAALSLEIRNVEGETLIGSALIRLGGDEYVPTAFPGDEPQEDRGEGSSHEAVWVDRYDARLLLDPHFLSTTNAQAHTSEATPASPSGWSDLPSDAEDTFFFSAEETDDYRRDKRRRLMEQTREERLKARMEEDGEGIWGGSDEEPDESEKEIMRRTAKSLLASPNAAQLEMRILANHGADPRFAFLRGRWSRSWQVVKARARADKLEEEQKIAVQTKAPTRGLVADYGDSDQSENGESGDPESEKTEKETMSSSNAEVEAAQELRRARAKEWMASRKAITTSD